LPLAHLNISGPEQLSMIASCGLHSFHCAAWVIEDGDGRIWFRAAVAAGESAYDDDAPCSVVEAFNAGWTKSLRARQMM
jgi:hypothetical protein